MIKIFKGQIYWAVLSIFFLTIIYVNISYSYSAMFYITNFLIVSISLFLLSTGYQYTYSLAKLFYLFIFFMFGIVPLNDIENGNIYWGGSPIAENFYTYGNFLILSGLFSFYIFGKIKLSKVNSIINFFDNFYNKEMRINLTSNIFFLFSSIIITIYILNFLHFDFYHIFFRGSMDGNSYDDDQITLLFFNNVIRPIPIFIFILYRYYSINSCKLSNHITGILLFLLAVLSISPTSIARFQAATLYGALFMTCFPNFLNGAYRMQLIFISGILYFFPFLNKFRDFNFDTFDFSVSLDSMNEGHFDAYQTFVRAISVDFVSYGHQLLGVILFFIPRVFWPQKPLGSGAQLADDTGLLFSNISMPFLGEGYVNFGLIGVLVFCGFLGFFISMLDNIYWSLLNNGRRGIFAIFYYLLFGLLFFMLRGDLLSSFAYSAGLICSLLLVSFFIKKIPS